MSTRKNHKNNRITINDLLREHRHLWPGGLTRSQYSIFNLMAYCRTGVLGSIEETCNGCRYTRIRPKSCGNRHCPLCMRSKQWDWAQKTCQRLPNVPHFHVVFTMPVPAADLFAANYALMTDVLFAAVAQTLHQFTRDNWNVHGGFLAVLHTWGGNLYWHPHLHVLVCAGGWDRDTGEWKEFPPDYLFPVENLSEVFAGIMLRRIEELDADPKMNWPERWESVEERWATRQSMARIPWVLYSKNTLSNTKAAVRYLARYTNRVAISNERITVDPKQPGTVRFSYKDYRNGGVWRMATMGYAEFFRRLALHHVPKAVHRIRFFGFLSPGRGVANTYPRLETTPEKAKTDAKCPKCSSESWTRRLTWARIDKLPRHGTLQGAAMDSSLASNSFPLRKGLQRNRSPTIGWSRPPIAVVGAADTPLNGSVHLN